MRMIAITTALVVAGCSPAGLSDGADGGTPTTGIYQVTPTTSGGCLPAAEVPDGNGIVSVEAPGVILLSMHGESFGPPLAGIPAGIAGGQFVHLADGTITQSFDFCGTHLQQTVTLEEQAADHVRARRVDIFSGVPATPVCTASVPLNDCTQTTEIEYRLTTPCPATCIQSPQPFDFQCGC